MKVGTVACGQLHPPSSEKRSLKKFQSVRIELRVKGETGKWPIKLTVGHFIFP